MKRLLCRLFVLGQLVLLGICCYGQWEMRQLEVTHTQLPAEALPGAGPLRILFFADLHNKKEQMEKIVSAAEQAKPDLILFGGDFIYSPERLSRSKWAINGFRRLTQIAPTYAIFGNQDYEMQDAFERVMQTAGVHLLRNEALDWTTPNGATIRLIGLGDYLEGDDAPDTCMTGESDKPVLLLSHDPESRWRLRQRAWNLMLSGHTHGGQACNPFTGKGISFRSSMPNGLYDFENGRRVFVTRGIGGLMKMRFFCKPEVAVIDIAG